MANVYYSKEINSEKIQELFEKVFNDNPINENERTAVKVHFGEKGNTRFVSPENIKPIIEMLKKHNSNHFITDTNTLYRGMRTNATDHLKIADEHGFNSLDCKIIIADGELGDEEENIQINKKMFEEVKIAKEIANADSMIVISHFKGHILFGFGGAIKNLGMGCGSRAGKLAMHSKIIPQIGPSCIGCGICAKNCDVDAIEIIDKKAKITDKCIGCAKCISVCPENAVQIPWHGATSNEAQARCAEYAYGATKDKKCMYFTFINNITKDCDCLHDSEIIGEDVGIIASTDPVACDQAAYDLVVNKHQEDIFLKNNNVDGTTILSYSEEIGLGKTKYDLINID